MDSTSFHSDAIYSPRRKLTLRGKKLESNLSTAVVLYKPPGKNRLLGRSLTGRNETKEVKFTPPNVEVLPKHIPHKSRCEILVKRITWILGIALALFILSILQSQKWTFNSCDNSVSQVSFETCKSRLTDSVYGQSTAINKILSALDDLAVTVNSLAILHLFGPSGTGKTYTLNVISQSLPPNVKQIRLHLPLLSIESVKMKLKHVECCRWNFIFIEDSDYANLNKIEETIRTLQTIQLNNTCHEVKIIVMFTSSHSRTDLHVMNQDVSLFQETEVDQPLEDSEVSKAEEYFTSPFATVLKSSNLDFTSVPYFPLGKEEIKACIMADLMAKKKNVSQQLIDQIMANIQFWQNDSQQISISGCKPVSAQVNRHI